MGDVAEVRSVLFLYCPEGVLEQRLLSRGKSSGRTDDNAETAKRRFRTYVETTLPVSQPLGCMYLFERNAGSWSWRYVGVELNLDGPAWASREG